ncbi:MAG: SBBP repeat-containing protein [Ginsengibacter sp.]
MKKISFILFLTSLAVLPVRAQKVNFEWAIQAGGSNLVDARGLSTITDASGNVYTTGFFTGQVDFDPGPGIYNLTSSDSVDVYIFKLDSTGKFLWAKQMDVSFNSISARGKAITADAVGNVFVTGDFLDVYRAWGCFVAKLDAAGNFLWIRKLGAFSMGTSIATDALGNVYTAGLFFSDGDFDPGPGLFNLLTGSSALFLSKLDSNGDFVWAKGVIGFANSNGTYGRITDEPSIAFDGSNNIYTVGSFIGEVDFDTGPGSLYLTSFGNANTRDLFVIKLDGDGNLTWARQMGGIDSDYGVSVAVDNSGNVYTAGNFSGTADFDPGIAAYNLNTLNGILNTFISKLDNSGNFIWAKQFAGNRQWCYSIALDNNGNIYTTGYFEGTLDVDPGAGVYNLSTAGYNTFISRLDGSGNFVWAKQLGGTATIISNSIVADIMGNIYTTGYFHSGQVDFDPGAGSYNLTSSDGDNIFVHKLSQCTNSTSSAIIVSACKNYTLNGQVYDTSGVYTQTLTNAQGCDSIITLSLTITTVNEVFNIAACKTFTWNNRIYIASGTYTDTLMTTKGCDSIITLNLSITPALFTTVSQSVCVGQSVGGHTASGNYADTLIAANGCDSIIKLQLTVLPNPSPNLGSDLLLCTGDSLLLYPGKFATYIWQDGSVQDHITIKKAGLYSVAVTDQCGLATDEIMIREGPCDIYFPTVFTPNIDGKNDQFKILGANTLTAYHLLVYNRWGRKVFETFDHSKGWDGSFNGQLQSLETFIWYCELKRQGETNTIKKKGIVTLIK